MGLELYAEATKYATFESCSKQLTREDNENAYNVLFLGPTGAGKSSLINKIFNEKVAKASASARSVTKEVNFYKGSLDCNGFSKKINLIDTIGFCDTRLSFWDIMDAITAIKANVSSSVIDKVIVVCSNRIEKGHIEAISQFMDWLSYESHKDNFVFIYNKADDLDEEEQLENIGYMCKDFGVDKESTAITLGINPRDEFERIRKELEKLKDAVTKPSKTQIKVEVQKIVSQQFPLPSLPEFSFGPEFCFPITPDFTSQSRPLTLPLNTSSTEGQRPLPKAKITSLCTIL